MRSFEVLVIRAYRAVDAFGTSGFRLSQISVIDVEGFPCGDKALKPSEINAIAGEIPGLHAIRGRKYDVRERTGTYRPNHVITE